MDNTAWKEWDGWIEDICPGARLRWVSSIALINQVVTKHLPRTTQSLNLTLHCSESSTETNPSFTSYSAGLLSLEWSTPQGCPRSGDNIPEDGDSGGEPQSSGNWGFFGFIKFLFWAAITGLLLYFAIGESLALLQAEVQAFFTITSSTLRKGGICYPIEIFGESFQSSFRIYSRISLQV
jgi:hypothetical protein